MKDEIVLSQYAVWYSDWAVHAKERLGGKDVAVVSAMFHVQRPRPKVKVDTLLPIRRRELEPA